MEPPSRPVRILAISGSLRTASTNSTLIRALVRLVPESVAISVYSELASLPHFNPDLDDDPPPTAVATFRAQLVDADAVLISSPEYAHGVPGSLKNALDWIVGSGELIDKPVALVNASPRARHAQASLAETIRTMSATLVETASITVPLSGRTLDESQIAADAELGEALRAAIASLASAAAAQRRP